MHCLGTPVTSSPFSTLGLKHQDMGGAVIWWKRGWECGLGEGQLTVADIPVQMSCCIVMTKLTSPHECS